MKYGVHAYLFTDRWSDGQIGILDTAKELGFDGIEIGVGDDVPFSAANAYELFIANETAWLRRQAWVFVANEANFMKSSSKNSALSPSTDSASTVAEGPRKYSANVRSPASVACSRSRL